MRRACCGAFLVLQAVCLRVAAARHILLAVGAHDGHWERKFIEKRKRQGYSYTPVLVDPLPRHAQHLAKLAKDYGGAFYPAMAVPTAAEARAHQKRRFFVNHNCLACSSAFAYSNDSFARPPLESHERLHPASSRSGPWIEELETDTVSLEELLEKHIAPDDNATLRIDCEGAEYELLRGLVLGSRPCAFQDIYVEFHSMRNPTLQPLRTFDVLLPWLLQPCGTNVHVDTNYFLDPHWRDADWPRSDGACRSCPLLYRPLDPSRPCPTTAMELCFSGDSDLTCPDCCDMDKYGLRGNERCWGRGIDMGTWVLPFTYDFCCAGIVPPKMFEELHRTRRLVMGIHTVEESYAAVL
mmetsp:Transcript_31234/g.57112  ORF Transcript_31234/g.57112 Transcript_31234/m.57112 type:complete len:353 (+) Transcript_31234:142-1200(+)